MKIIHVAIRYLFSIPFGFGGLGLVFTGLVGLTHKEPRSHFVLVLIFISVGAFFIWCAYSLIKSARHISDAENPEVSTVSVVVGTVLLLGLGTAVYRKFIMFVPGQGMFRAAAGRQMLGNLGAMRSAMSIYYGDMEAQYPSDLTAFTANNRWGMRIVKADTGMHPPNEAIQLMTAAEVATQSFRDDGGWYYVTSGSNTGNIGINCVHTDVKGSVWNSY